MFAAAKVPLVLKIGPLFSVEIKVGEDEDEDDWPPPPVDLEFDLVKLELA